MGHTTIEWVYVGVVVAVLIYIGADAWNIERLLEHAPPEASVVKVTAAQWFWTFEHEDGTQEIGELHLVKDVPYRFEITSQDVIHSFNTPDFGMMTDAVPGRINSMWFLPDQSGEFLIQCREYCGFAHYDMRASMIVEEPSDGEQEQEAQVASATPAAAAESDLTPSIGSTAVES